jgi:hypothetical protein
MSTSEAKPVSSPPRPPKAKKARSPSYPFINLEQAVKFAKILWEKEKREAALIPVVAAHWGYAPKSSGGILSASALKKYGLALEESTGDRRMIRLSDLALDIIRHEDSLAERAPLLKKAALNPEIHRDLWETKRDSSDASIHKYLEFDKKFTSAAANSVIKVYRDTISFAKLTDSDSVANTEQPEEEFPIGPPADKTMQTLDPIQQRRQTPPLPSWSTLIDIPVPLPSGSLAYYRVPPSMPETDFKFYQAVLTAYKEGLVKGSRTFPARAKWKNKDHDVEIIVKGVMGYSGTGTVYYESGDGTGISERELEFIDETPKQDSIGRFGDQA